MKRQLAFESLEGKLLQSVTISGAAPLAAAYARIDRPAPDDDPTPRPESDPGPLPTGEPPIIIPPLPPSGPAGPGCVAPGAPR
ncbi:hypothetical protein OJF2_28280 [Aquisphaera giovannonii]|uniref:Uncharacterized protein n=1 Tax=Aquisphaera giovannonii TaxID=406548 RepID=A0A5B9W159_9BACT|nr:hypothetical protein [Aquisphaera giovannonii]QEH34293.1 hypothetical protein OJF2_28280 [Aquisphaera giovannonii]